MKTIGLLGGMSWESTLVYYRLINQGVRERLGGLHSAPIVLKSLDFSELESLQSRGDWQSLEGLLIEAAGQVEKAGADCLLIASNTMHRLAGPIAAAIDIPVIHVVDVTADALKRDGIERVGLLGTRMTMSAGFWRDHLENQSGIPVAVPDAEEQELLDRIIFEELCHGVIRDDSRRRYLQAIARLNARGADAVILGCTELGMLVSQADIPVTLYDTTPLHAAAAVDFVMGQ